MRTPHLTGRMSERILSPLLGLYWKYRHIFSPDWGKSYLEKIGHPVSVYIASRVTALGQPSSVLEFGASSGPNLFEIKRLAPQSSCAGLDISREAVRAGNAYILKNEITGITLRAGSEKELENLASGSFDVVFAAAVLIYLDEESLKRTILAMFRLAKTGVVIIEQDSEAGKSVFDGRKWLHDYKSVFREVLPGVEIAVEKIHESVWGGDWGKRGYVYTIRKPAA